MKKQLCFSKKQKCFKIEWQRLLIITNFNLKIKQGEKLPIENLKTYFLMIKHSSSILWLGYDKSANFRKNNNYLKWLEYIFIEKDCFEKNAI